MVEQRANKPAKEFRVSGSRTAIWHNRVERDGQIVTQHSIKVQKSYQDSKTGNWVNMEMNLFPSEIPGMILVLQKAYEECLLRQNGENPDVNSAI